MIPVLVASGLSAGEDPEPLACALATACASEWAGDGALVVAIDGTPRGPTMLASAAARECETAISALERPERVAARGRVCRVALGGDELGDDLEELIAAARGVGVIVLAAPAPLTTPLADALGVGAVVMAADHHARGPLARLAVAEHHAAGRLVKLVRPFSGAVPVRRARAGLEVGGEAGRRIRRVARDIGSVLGASAELERGTAVPAVTASPRGTAVRREPEVPLLARVVRPLAEGRRLLGRAGDDRGQVMPLALAAVMAIMLAAAAAVALGGALAGGSRVQRAADLAAISAARSMKSDWPRLFVPATIGGLPNPLHLSKLRYKLRARAAAYEAAERNGADPRRIRVEFPKLTFAPSRVEVALVADLESGEQVEARAEAAILSELGDQLSQAQTGRTGMASGGGYSGPLEMRQGVGMRLDVAAAFDRMAAAADEDGIALMVNSGFRSDAEQAALFDANPDPRMVAPPGQSLHRCATELDLGPSSAYTWLAQNATRFGFVQRYSWEAWHYGYTAGPQPCSAAGENAGGAAAPRSRSGEGARGGGALPEFVPARYRDLIAGAAARHDVSGTLLSAQLMAESGFNPYATSPAGAQGIAQFMPGTAAAMGLRDPFDAAQAIDAQARLMRDLLGQFGSVELALAAYNAGPGAVEGCDCIPPYPETQDYVTRILGLMGGSGASTSLGAGGLPQILEVRLVG
ncbi:transglycosylase SLT domain-containing protein [Thermoleophilia bacterium SCSIO 60948]|nr:transglycosylase SLT domain-containing protein [Thermoleophilia bacterium SCSIO 60948]